VSFSLNRANVRKTARLMDADKSPIAAQGDSGLLLGTVAPFFVNLSVFLKVFFAGFIVVIGSACLFLASNQVKAQSSALPLQARILGGESASKTFPWMMSFQFRDNSGNFRHLCGAILVTPRVALTAAHCLNNLSDKTDIQLSWSETNRLPGASDPSRSIEEYVIHPSFDPLTLSHDIALLLWAEPIEDRQPLAIATPQTDSSNQLQWGSVDAEALSSHESEYAQYSGFTLLPGLYQSGLPLSSDAMRYSILGWGTTDMNEVRLSGELLVADAEIYDQAYCSSRLVNRVGTSFCAGSRDGTVDSCFGDSGGPLISQTQTVYRDPETDTVKFEMKQSLVGLVSYGTGCGVPDQPGFYTDVMQLIPFIQGVTLGRDHWIRVGWWGQDLEFNTRLRLLNQLNQSIQLGSLSGQYAEGVKINGAGCEQKLLLPGQDCVLRYEFKPVQPGKFVISTPYQYQVLQADGAATDETGYLHSTGQTLGAFSVTTAFSGVGERWFNGGDQPWEVDQQAFAAGTASLRSGPIGANQSSVLQGFLNGPQTIDLFVYVESEAGFDELRVRLNEQLIFVGSAMEDWATVKLIVPTEGAVLEFEYRKDGSINFARDSAWIDFESFDTEGRSLETVSFVTTNTEPASPVAGSSGGGGAMGVLYLMLMLKMFFVRRFRSLFFSSQLTHSQLVSRGAPGLLSMALVFLSINLVACAGSESVQIKSSKPKAVHTSESKKKSSKHQFKPQEEPLYAKSYSSGRLTLKVRTFGCTRGEHFRLVEHAGRPGWYTVERIKPDHCRRAPMLTTIVIPVPDYVQKKLILSGHGEKILLTNMNVPNTGLPEIPFD